MAKSSLIQKNKKILKNYIKKKESIINYKKKNKNKYSIFFFFKYNNLKKKSSIVKYINRCYITGKQRSVYRIFLLNRNLIRKLCNFGYIIGIEKSSW